MLRKARLFSIVSRLAVRRPAPLLHLRPYHRTVTQHFRMSAVPENAPPVEGQTPVAVELGCVPCALGRADRSRENGEPLSKGEIKRREKEAAKEVKRLEREKKMAEEKAARDAADVVRRPLLVPDRWRSRGGRTFPPTRTASCR